MSNVTLTAALRGPGHAKCDTRAGAARRFGSQLLLAVAVAFASAGSVQAQVVPLVVVDVKAVAVGLQASKLIGMDVRNSQGEKIGTIDDLIILPRSRIFAVLQVGGFLGVGGRLVVVPFDSLTITAGGTRASLRGGTKEALRKLPEFNYSKK